MNPELQSQTEQIVKALETIHYDILSLHITTGALLVVLVLALVVVPIMILRRRR
jgi:hypothetical protein